MTRGSPAVSEGVGAPRRLVREHAIRRLDAVGDGLGVAILGFDGENERKLAEAATAAVLAASFSLPEFKAKPTPPRIRSLRLLALAERVDLDRTIAEARGNNLARWLTALPPNVLDARNYADALKQLAAEKGWQYKRYSTKELEKIGAGAFLAVAQGNDNDSASIVRLRYRPGKATVKPDLSLVGPADREQVESVRDLEVGQRDMGDASFDYEGLIFRWFDRWLKDQPEWWESLWPTQ